MHATYDPATGAFAIWNGGNPVHVATGYSGNGDGLNNPALEHERAVGPLPQAVWRIGAPTKHQRLGPNAFPLTLAFGSAYGRSGFFIHGDNRKGDRSASSGCIVLGPKDRQKIADLRPSLLIVAEA